MGCESGQVGENSAFGAYSSRIAIAAAQSTTSVLTRNTAPRPARPAISPNAGLVMLSAKSKRRGRPEALVHMQREHRGREADDDEAIRTTAMIGSSATATERAAAVGGWEVVADIVAF